MTAVRRAAAVVVAVGLATGPGWADPAHAAPGPSSAPQYYFDQWDVPGLWAGGARGQGVVIAALDTGVNGDVAAFDGRLLSGTDLGEQGGDGQVDRDTDRFGHGTAMASLMVAAPTTFDVTGLAPAAQVLPVALPLVGTADEADDDRLPDAIRYAADHGAKIISMSLGQTRAPTGASSPCNPSEQEAIFYALDKGAVLVAAGGNQGESGSPVVDPGVCLGVVSVGAVGEDGAVAAFSSRHPYLTMTAPGVDIASLGRLPGTAYAGDGTSQATAIAAAALALAWSAHPDLDGRGLVARLLATLQPGPGQAAGTHDDAYGYGRLDARALVTASVPADAANPLYDLAAPFRARYTASLQGIGLSSVPSRSAAPTDVALPTAPPPAKGHGTVVVGVVIGAAGLLLAAGAWVGYRRVARDAAAGLSGARTGSSR